MYEILKRALDEALTAAYAGELPAGAEEVAFSEGFEREMRGLIRKTDRPIRKYVRFLTVAACAAIAVGCAVLLPRLLSQPVPVVPGESVTTTESAAQAEDRPEESASAVETETTPEEEIPDREISDENPGAAGGFLPPDEDENADVTERDNEVAGSSGNASAVSSDEETGVAQTEETDAPADDSDDEDADDDWVDESEAEWVDDSDDDDVSSDDSDDDAWDSDEATDESALPALAQKETLNEEIEALIGCSLADSYLQSGDFLIDGKFYSVPIVEGIDPETYRDPALAERIGAAEYLGDELPETELALALFWGNVGKEPPVIQPIRDSDQSDRNHYGELYFGEDSEIGDEEDEFVMPISAPYLEFFRNGIVVVYMNGYSGTAVYRLDDETLSVLTERVEARHKQSEPKTVGALAKRLGTAEDYAQVIVTISRYYDCTMYGALSDGSFLAELLEKYKKEKLAKPDSTAFVSVPIRIALTSKKTLQTESFDFYADGTVIVSGNKRFMVDPADVRAILTEYCRQKKLPAPVFYETLGEYLSDKNFTTLTASWREPADGGSALYLSGDSAEIRALVEAGMAESAYLPGEEGFVPAQTEHIRLEPEGWSSSLYLSRDRIMVGRAYVRRVFAAPEGLYDKILAILEEKGTDPYAAQDGDYFDDDVEDD